MKRLKRLRPFAVRAFPLFLLIGYFLSYEPRWSLLPWSFVVYFFLGVIGIEIGFHRYFSHQSFKTDQLREGILLVLGSLAGLGSPLQFVHNHRKHHRYADTVDDPHSPHILPKWRVLFLFLQKSRFIPELVGDFSKRSFHRLLHRHYWKAHLGLSLLWFILSPDYAVFLFLIPVELVRLAVGLVNTWGHGAWSGYRNFVRSERSQNVGILNVVVFGAAYHNNHHENPSQNDTAVMKSEWDGADWIVRNVFQKTQ